MDQPKIATCCYCGTKAALTLGRKDRVELVCRACGAPISVLKPLKASPPPKPTPQRSPARERETFAAAPPRKRRKKSEKRRRGGLRATIEELIDELDDVFDDLFD